MALYADRVKDSTSLTGTGAVTLSGTASAGYQTFATAFGATPQTVAYCIADQTGSNWEVGTGVFNGTTGLTRVTVLASSSGGSLVNFTGGTQDVFCTAPAAYLLSPGANTQVAYNNAGLPGASANFTYTSGTNTLTTGNITGSALSMTIQPKTPTFLEAAGTLAFAAKNAVISNGNGGSVSFTSGNGDGTGSGGNLNFSSGSGVDGGGLSILAGNGSQNGGAFTARAGDGYTGVAGGFTLTAGNNERSGGAAGTIALTSGIAVGGDGGDIYLSLGFGGINNGSLLVTTDVGTVFEATLDSGTFANRLGFYGVTPVDQPAPTASGTQNVLDSVVSSLINLGLIQSGGFSNITSVAPAGADTQIQYNNAGALDASANFTYNSATNTVALGPNTGTATFTTRAPTATTIAPTTLVIAGQNSIRTTGTTGVGGAVTIQAGNGRPTGAGATGGAVNINAGTGVGTTSGIGGAINITAGNSTLTTSLGGALTLRSGNGATTSIFGGNNSAGDGGSLTLQSGIASGATGNGGAFQLFGGQAINGNGGNFEMRGGLSSNGTGGSCVFVAGYSSTGQDGSIAFNLPFSSSPFPGSVFVVNDATIAFEITSNATTGATKMGFFGATPVEKPAAVPVTAAGIHAALVSLGLIT